MPGPRDYKTSDIKRLFAHSNNTCAHPDCQNSIIGTDKGQTVFGKICHIEAASKNGPRFNKDMGNDARRSFENLILLCDEHHSIIDNKENEAHYPKEKLLYWKNTQIQSSKKQRASISDEIIEELIFNSKNIVEKIDRIEGQMEGHYLPVIDASYVERGLEGVLKKTLKEDNILLLTGISFCGKSEIAKHIAEYFQNSEDFIYKRVSTVRDASSFLESTQNARICLLEDPFGHHLGDENILQLGLLRSLFKNLPSQNLLIVTSRKEVVLSVFKSPNLKDCKLNHIFWNDLTVQDSDFLKHIWHLKVKKHPILTENEISVQKLLNNKQPLQPGQLDYLAKSPELRESRLNSEAIYHMAQVDAGDIARSILEREDLSWLVLAVLGLAASSIVGPSRDDLIYILQKEKALLSLRKKDRFEDISLFETEEGFIIPEYSHMGELLQQYEAALDFLEERGFIVFQDEEYRFRHPQYREIGKALFSKFTSSKQRRVITAIHNSLTCMNSNVAYNTAYSLSFIFETFSIDKQQDLIKYLDEVSDLSIFPKVSDQTFLLVIQNFRRIAEVDFDSEIYYRLQTALESSRIIFKDGNAYRYKSGVLAEEFYFTINDSKYDDLLQKLEREGILSQQEAWEILSYLERKKQSGSLNFLEFIINSNEVFIRTKAAYIIFRDIQHFHDYEIVDKILEDRHPSIRYFALMGFFQGMTESDDDAIIKFYGEKFKAFFKNDELFSIRASTFMSNFDTDYASDSLDWEGITQAVLNKWWYYWGELFPVFMDSFPRNARFFHAPRFSGTMNAAGKQVSSEQAVAISKSLVSFAETNFKYRDLDNFEMHIIDFLIEATEDKPILRFPIFKKLISGDFPTAFIVYNYSWALSKWGFLLEQEKRLMLSTIKSDRSDVRWIKAFLICEHSFLMPEIQEAIFGDSQFMEKPVKDLLEEIPRQLLEDGITVFINKNPAFVHIGHGGMGTFWPPIVKHIARNNLPIKYKECVEEIIRLMINGSFQEIELWGDIRELWNEVFLNSDRKDDLLEWTKKQVSNCNFTFHNTGFVFEVIINYYTEEGRRNFLVESLAKDLNYLSSTAGQLDIFRVLKYEDFYKEVLMKFPEQLEILNNLIKLTEKKTYESDFIREVDGVLMTLEDQDIVLRRIVDYLRKLIPKMSGDQEKKAEKFISDFFERSKFIRREYNYSVLPDWVYAGRLN